MTFTDRPATSVVTRRALAVVDVWIADYSRPDPATDLVPGTPAAPSGHARVRLQLLAAPGTKVDGPGRYPATASKDRGVGRATLIVETSTKQHAAYSKIQGEATLTTYDEHRLCGTFRIGDDVTSATGSFSASF